MGAAQLDALDEAAFRAHVRAWIEANCPEDLRFPQRRLHWRDNRPWYLKLSAQGWLAPAWPREHGGLGLGAAKQLILIEELERHGAPRISDMGVLMLGPLLIRHGSPEQQARFLPRILSGEDIWAQGYSEPDAGSDLAALRLEAADHGDHFVLNGQKTWITFANDANWIFVLARTDKAAKKQEGISFLLLPMDSPGISVRPILNLDLHDEFCEVFFDDVRVPKSMLVGEVNKGWTYAKALLGFERIAIGSPRLSANALAAMQRLAVAVAALKRGEPLGPDASILKIVASELFQRISEAMLELAGEQAGLLHPMPGPALHPAGQFLLARPATIFGGSSEILRNVLSRALLDLPA
ncbi:MAG: acyl-CoA dehydrogenase [Rhodospirillales bacterium 12-71-4]|nr:MAG: acyl-CoA dehydrogenase [Rhodospirillales bacterium 12-71-4]